MATYIDDLIETISGDMSLGLTPVTGLTVAEINEQLTQVPRSSYPTIAYFINYPYRFEFTKSRKRYNVYNDFSIFFLALMPDERDSSIIQAQADMEEAGAQFIARMLNERAVQKGGDNTPLYSPSITRLQDFDVQAAGVQVTFTVRLDPSETINHCDS